MGILRKISSFAATALVAVAPLCIGFCAAPFAAASPIDTPTTSTSTTNPAGQSQDLTQWAQDNCPGGKQFDNNTYTNTPIYLGYADGKTYLGYTEAKKATPEGAEKKFVDPRPDDPDDPNDPDAKYKKEIGTCVRVAAEETGQASANVYYGALFKADKSSLSASGFSKNTETVTVFQVTKKATAWEPGTKVESRISWTSDNYQEMPYSVAKGQSDSGFKNLLSGDESAVDLLFSQSGFYTIYLRAITTDPSNPDKSYQTEMAYTFIVGKEASVPKDLQDVVDGKDQGGSDNPPTPNPGETTPDTPTPEPGDEGGGTHPGTNPTPKPAVTPNPRTPNHGDTGRISHPGATPAPRPGAAPIAPAQNNRSSSRTGLAPLLPQQPADIVPNLSQLGSLDSLGADNPPATNPSLDSPSQQGAGDNPGNNDALKFQAATGSTDQATKQWIRSSSLAVFGGGIAIAGLTGIGLLIFSRLNP